MAQATAAPPALLLLVGPDRARKLARVRQLAQSLRVDLLDQHQCEGAELSAARLDGLIRTQPSLSPRRFLVIDEAQQLSKSCVEVLAERAAHVTTTNVALLLETAPADTHPVAILKACATIERFDQATGSANEAPAARFALVEAVGRRDAASALRAVHEQLAEGRDVVEFLGMIGWQIQRWLTVQRLLDAHTPTAQVSAVTGIQSWQLNKLAAELRGRSVESLQALLARCHEVDVAIKTGTTLPRIALEQLVVEACLSSEIMPSPTAA